MTTQPNPAHTRAPNVPRHAEHQTHHENVNRPRHAVTRLRHRFNVVICAQPVGQRS